MNHGWTDIDPRREPIHNETTRPTRKNRKQRSRLCQVRLRAMNARRQLPLQGTRCRQKVVL